MFLYGRPLSGSTLLRPWDPVFLHLTFDRISPGIILRTIGSWVGEAANMVPPGNIAVIFKGGRFLKLRPTFEAAIVIVIGVGGG